MDFLNGQILTWFIFLLVKNNLDANAEKFITIWEHGNSQGATENLCVSHCSNLRHPKTIKLGTSVNLQGNCARVYDEFNCSGKSVELLPNSPSLNDFTQWNMDNRISSVGPCRNECAIDVTGKYNGEDIEVQLYNQANYKGNDGTLIGTGCLSVPNSFIDHVMSIKTFGQCIQLYNSTNCVHSGTNTKSIELRKETYFHNDFVKWTFPKVQSISHCRYKCDDILRQPKTGEVTIFDKVNNAGSWLKVKIDKCTNLPYQWEAAAKSVELTDVTCVAMYEDFECAGEPFVVKSNTDNLISTRGNLPIRSVCKCQEPIDSSSPKHAVSFLFVVASLLILMGLVGVFFLGKRFGFVKHDNLSHVRENGVAQCENGNDMETRLQENDNKIEGNLLKL